MNGRFVPLLLSASLCPLLWAPPTSRAAAPKIRLAVLIIVDQLRGDAPLRLEDRFGPDGFRRFLDQGAWYECAHYRQSSTFTAVGHATLITGAPPRHHGLVANHWADPTTGETIYCVQDDQAPVLGQPGESRAGRSPRNLHGSTLGDELVLATSGKARVVGISIKDRGAILPAGHLGSAYWFSPRAGGFVTSRYYHDTIPDWVSTWNNAGHIARYAGKSWDLKHPPSSYRQPDSRKGESGHPALGPSFPHPLPAPGDEAETAGQSLSQLAGILKSTPFGDELTVSFALQAVDALGLGADPVPDLLSVSLSACDYIGHAYGPQSREMEDHILRLDGILAELFLGLDQRVGLEHTLVMLSSDHGSPGVPEVQLALGLPAGRWDAPTALARADQRLRQEFGVDVPTLGKFLPPAIYLHQDAIEAIQANPGEIRARAAQLLEAEEGIARAFSREDLEAKCDPGDALLGKLQRAHHPQRSGDITLVPAPFWFVHPNPQATAAMHGSPYEYDTHVPLAFVGPEIRPGRHVRPAAPSDLAPTVAALLRISAPALSDGRVLTEALERATP